MSEKKGEVKDLRKKIKKRDDIFEFITYQIGRILYYP